MTNVFLQLAVYAAGLLMLVEAQQSAIIKLFKIGVPSTGVIPRHPGEGHLQYGSYSSGNDNILIVCFGVVTAYIAYIIISFFIKPKLQQTTIDLSNNPGLKALLASHHFRDNGMPAKMRNLYDTTADDRLDQSYIGGDEKSSHPTADVHSTPVKHAGKIVQL